ncbi:MAG: hypothetical protein ACRDTA_09185 [Pseudonocardiaceae bacterium]
MRDEHPVWRDAYGIWHVFRYTDAARAISDPQVFSSDVGRVLPVGQKFTRNSPERSTTPPRTCWPTWASTAPTGVPTRATT